MRGVTKPPAPQGFAACTLMSTCQLVKCCAGLGEITALYERLTASRSHREGHLMVLPLHSTISSGEQRRWAIGLSPRQ